MRTEKSISSLQITVKSMRFNKDTRMLELTTTFGGEIKLPKETSFTQTIKPGCTIIINKYEVDGQPYTRILNFKEIEIGHYGPLQKDLRDSFYKFEASRKASGLIWEEQMHQAHEAFYDPD